MRRIFDNDYEKARYCADRAMFWSRVSIAFSVIALVAIVVGAFLRAA